MPVIAKIFSLPKIATQSPRGVLLAGIRESPGGRRCGHCTMRSCENGCGTGVSIDIDKCMCRVFAHYSHRCATAPWFDDERASRNPTSARQHFLKPTLFFSMCWCIRDVVHFDSRVHAAIKPSHYIRRATWPRKLRRQRRRRAQ
jgi:hypothetical protein